MLMKTCATAICFVCAWCAVMATSHADLTVRGYSPLLHDRFNNHPSFIGSGIDWSGVARSSDGAWATMISDTYFLSAAHFHPGIGSTLTIYGSNDVNGPQQSVNIVGGQGIAGSDLWLGQIDQATNFATYSVVAPTDLVGLNVFMFGVSSAFPNAAQMRLGRNTIESLSGFPIDQLPNPNVYIYDYDAPTGGVGDDEAIVVGGDSGAPSFIMVGNTPVLLGVHWFRYDGNVYDSSSGSGDSAIPLYINQLNQAMGGGQQLSIVFVPEPNAMALVGLSLAAWGCRRRLRRANRQQDAA